MKIGLQTWGSDGDIRPFIALAGGLRGSGHEVSLVITSVDNKDYSSYGKEMGFAVSHVGALLYDEKALQVIGEKIVGSRLPLRQLEILLTDLFHPLSSEMFEASQRLCREHNVIIGHFMHYPAQAAAEQAGKPYATVMLNHLGIFSKHSAVFGAPKFGKWMNPFWRLLSTFLVDRVVGPEVNRLREREHLPPAKNIFDTVWTSPRLNLLAVSAAICRKQPDWPEYHQVCGFFNVSEAAEKWTMPEDLKKFLDSGSPPVYMTLGSMLSADASPEIITETLVQGALLAGCRAIVQSSWDKMPDFPDHPHIYKIQKAPHRYIFPFCSAVVHHGGAGTTHSATLHGCPSLVIEHFGDQIFWASELQRLGVAPGALHRRNITATKLAKAISNVLDSPSMKKKADELGGLMQKEDGVKKAVELIEDRFIT